MNERDRLAYKGITKKMLRTLVQRLVLILPVEDQATSTQAMCKSTCSNVTVYYDVQLKREVCGQTRTQFMRTRLADMRKFLAHCMAKDVELMSHPTYGLCDLGTATSY